MKDKKRNKAKFELSNDDIKKIYNYHFGNTDSLEVTELAGGLKSSVYLLEDANNKMVLKLAPNYVDGVITVDKNLLSWEAKILKDTEQLNIPTPRLIVSDYSLNIYPIPYIIMTYLEGDNYLHKKEELSQTEIENIEKEIGIISSKICSIKSSDFFLPSKPNLKFEDNFTFIKYLFDALIKDGIDNNLDVSKETLNIIKNILSIYKESLNNISEISLTNTDMWDGNILVKNGHVSGVIDFADVYYCDELMTFYFHTIDGITSKHFLEGYNKKHLNKNEEIRCEIYRLYVILKMITECKIKEYGRYDWMYTNLDTRIRNLKK